jgi:hypothetical protein
VRIVSRATGIASERLIDRGQPVGRGIQTMTSQARGRELESLAPLVGRWEIRGRTVGAKDDDIMGESTFSWSSDRAFLEQRSILRVGTEEVHALEIIGQPSRSGDFPAWVFSGASPKPLRYSWRLEGEFLVHLGLGATSRGRWSADQKTIAGAWRPDDPTNTAPGSSYDWVMTRIDAPP